MSDEAISTHQTSSPGLISGLKESDIHKINREIIELTLSHGIRSQVAVVYNEGLLLQNLSGLLELFLEVQKEIRDASRAAWIVQEREEIYKFLFFIVK